MSYSEHAKMGYVYPWQWNKTEKTSLLLRKLWGKSSRKEICASVELVMSLAEEEVRQSRKVPTDLHLPSEHTSRETHLKKCSRSAHFAVKKDDEATALEVLGQKGM